jgi:hypothetical protein
MDEPLDVSHLRLQRRIRVSCTPAVAYDLISDVGAMSSFSPELVWARYDDGHGPTVGSWFTGRNRGPKGEWDTRSRITEAEPGVSFGWTVMVDGRSIGQWTYRFEPDEHGTWIEEAWQVNNWIPILGRTPGELLELRSHTADMMDDTLRALARHIEDD